MATIVTRAGKGSALTHNEVDANFNNLNNAKYESGNNVTFGTIEGSTITATTGFSGNLTGNVTGDVSGNAGTVTNGVYTTGNQTIGGTKTFSSTILGNLTGDTSGAHNGTVGATTPAAGTFTSLSDSGNLTFTGTGNRILGDFSNATVANRVAFQTSTANTGTSLITLPNGTGTASQLLTFSNSDPSNASFTLIQNTGIESIIGSNRTGTGTFLPMTFYTGGSERMRIDTSGNVGIGTSSPAGKLDIGNTSAAFTDSIIRSSTTGISELRFADTTINAGFIGYEHTDNSMKFGTNASERMRIDSAGNVGIGTSSPVQKLVVSSAGDTRILVDATDANPARIQLRTAHTSPNNNNWSVDVGEGGTRNLRFTDNLAGERMRIDSSGNVGIGTSSPLARVHVFGAGQQTANLTDAGNRNAFLRVSEASAAANAGGGILFSNQQADAANSIGFAAIKGLLDDGSNNTTGHLAFSTRGSSSATSLTERMRIDSSGSIGIATASGSTIKLRIASATDWLMIGRNAADTADIIRIGNAGDVANLNNSYGGFSDIKLKENVVDATPKLEKLNQVRVVNYNLKENPDQKLLGVVAQELEEIFPGMVGESPDIDKDGKALDTTTKSVKYSVFVPMLIKAIQEQQALIENLTTRLTALEGN